MQFKRYDSHDPSTHHIHEITDGDINDSICRCHADASDSESRLRGIGRVSRATVSIQSHNSNLQQESIETT